tara:strand:- start:9793 stop:10302 length:510 start_codon:yes stop_codon:yes gene_type:complete
MSREKLLDAGWYKNGDDHVHWFHERFMYQPMSYDEACATLGKNTPEGWSDMNTNTLEEHVEFLKARFMIDSSGEAFSVYKLIGFYETNKDRDPDRSETEPYSIKDEWVRHNAQTDRVIAEGMHHVHGTFTEEEAKAYIAKQPERVELEKFNQYRLHTYVTELITSKPLI